jgi:hypothetical protein
MLTCAWSTSTDAAMLLKPAAAVRPKHLCQGTHIRICMVFFCVCRHLAHKQAAAVSMRILELSATPMLPQQVDSKESVGSCYGALHLLHKYSTYRVLYKNPTCRRVCRDHQAAVEALQLTEKGLLHT